MLNFYSCPCAYSYIQLHIHVATTKFLELMHVTLKDNDAIHPIIIIQWIRFFLSTLIDWITIYSIQAIVLSTLLNNWVQ